MSAREASTPAQAAADDSDDDSLQNIAEGYVPLPKEPQVLEYILGMIDRRYAIEASDTGVSGHPTWRLHSAEELIEHLRDPNGPIGSEKLRAAYLDF